MVLTLNSIIDILIIELTSKSHVGLKNLIYSRQLTVIRLSDFSIFKFKGCHPRARRGSISIWDFKLDSRFRGNDIINT